ncbi:hypothetical protein [Crocosphaera sp. Alani8]|uniref:hypothetical protein n=1 Tax=Crocosphaera sp. Alani8 TaxID=3038952 RepID=UPI00313C839D
MFRIEFAKKQAWENELDIPKCEILLEKIRENFNVKIIEKYEIIFYLSLTGLYNAEDIAEIFGHSPKNINADFNKNLGHYIRSYLELEDTDRVGITSIRRILYKAGYFKEIYSPNPIINIRRTSKY